MIYHLPILSRPDCGLLRAPGPGLGNLLFPIARAVIGQCREGGTLVLPTIRQIKIGTFLRAERDKRTYGDIFRHRSPAELLHWLSARLARSTPEGDAPKGASATIRYEGMARQFHDIAGYADTIAQFLTSRSTLPIPHERYDIAMHVRLGDFAAAKAGAARQNTRIPLGWYRDALALAQELLGRKALRGVLFTDEDPARVIDKLGLQGFVPEPPGNALTSMLALGRADVLIGSRSTFSLWGRYFGKGAAIWPEGFDLEHYAPLDKTRDIFV